MHLCASSLEGGHLGDLSADLRLVFDKRSHLFNIQAVLVELIEIISEIVDRPIELEGRADACREAAE